MPKALRLSRVYRGWWIVLVGYFTQLTNSGASGWVFGVLILPMQTDLGWTRSQVVGAITMQRLVAGAAGFFYGPLVDRHGSRVLMTISAMIGGCCLMGMSTIQQPWQPWLWWGIFGLVTPGLGSMGPVVSIANWFIKKRPQAVMVYTFGSATAGTILAPTMAWVAEATDWRIAWRVMGVMMFCIAPLAWIVIRHRPEDYGLLPDGESPETHKVDEVETRASFVDEYWTVGKALRSKSFWLLTLGFMMTSLPISSVFIHMSSFVQNKGFSAADGAGAVSIYGMGVFAGRFVWGFTTSRVGLHRLLILYGSFYAISLLIFLPQSTVPSIYATAVLLGISVAGGQQLQAQAFPDYFGRRIVGRLLGYAGVMSTVTGASAPLLAAVMFDKTGSYELTFTIFAVCCFFASLSFFFSKPRYRSVAAQVASI